MSSPESENMNANETTAFLIVKGKVQNVMFRQTVMRGAMKRGLIAGATNVKTDRHRVDITLTGDSEKIKDMIDTIASKKKLNSWGACAESVTIAKSGKPALEHEVNTSNVDSIKWKQGVQFYL